MPGLDKTGPFGEGPMTGRRMGRCTNFGAFQQNKNNASEHETNENFPDNTQGQGLGFGFGRGRGRGRGGRGMGRRNRFRGGF